MEANEERFDSVEDIFRYLGTVVKPTLIGMDQPEELVKEAMQEAALSLWQQIKQGEAKGERKTFNHTYIFKRARRCLSQLMNNENRSRLVPEKDDVMAEDTASEGGARLEAMALLQIRVKLLEDSEKVLCEWCIDPDKRKEDVAERLNIKPHNVDVRTSRLKEKLFANR